MDILKSIIISIVAGTLLSGCYRDFEPDLYEEPVVCLSALLKVGEPVTVQVTHTWRYDQTPTTFVNADDVKIDNADVTLIVNGQEIEHLVYDDAALYVGNYIVREGDSVTINVTSSNYGDATASVEVPVKVPIDNINNVVLSANGDYVVNNRIEATIDFQMSFTDPATVQNYYMADVENEFYGMAGNVFWMNLDYNREPLFSEIYTPMESMLGETNGYSMFTDRSISGQSYPLTLSTRLHYTVNTTDPDAEPNKLTFHLLSISKSYYDYLLSVYQVADSFNGQLGNFGLSEQRYTYSNVSTGAGIVAACAIDTRVVNLTEIIANAVN